MNLIGEIQDLPRRSQLELAAMILKRHKPTINDLAEAGGVSDSTARRWFLTESQRKDANLSDADRYRQRGHQPLDPIISQRMDASIAAMLHNRATT